MAFMAGISISQPSKPNRFSDVHLRAKNASNLINQSINQKQNWIKKESQEILLIETSSSSSQVPGSSGHPGQKESFGIVIQVHDSGRLETLADPVALFQRVDEHELDTDVTAVGRFQPAQDLPERQGSFVGFADESGGGQFEHPIHIVFVCRKGSVSLGSIQFRFNADAQCEALRVTLTEERNTNWDYYKQSQMAINASPVHSTNLAIIHRRDVQFHILIGIHRTTDLSGQQQDKAKKREMILIA